MEPRAGLNGMEKRKFTAAAGEKIPVPLSSRFFPRVLYNRPAVVAFIPYITDYPRLVQQH